MNLRHKCQGTFQSAQKLLTDKQCHCQIHADGLATFECSCTVWTIFGKDNHKWPRDCDPKNLFSQSGIFTFVRCIVKTSLWTRLQRVRFRFVVLLNSYTYAKLNIIHPSDVCLRTCSKTHGQILESEFPAACTKDSLVVLHQILSCFIWWTWMYACLIDGLVCHRLQASWFMFRSW